MDETPSPASSSRSGSLGKKIQHRHAAEDDDGVDPIECTGKSCQSCTAGILADCVAVCCCPCAVVDILAFTFLKIPYLMGRRWLTKGRRKKKEKTSTTTHADHQGVVAVEGRNGNSRIVSRENKEVTLENEVMRLGNEEVKNNFSVEEEDVWLELYNIGHLGFGRVSFSTGGSSSKRNITNI